MRAQNGFLLNKDGKLCLAHSSHGLMFIESSQAIRKKSSPPREVELIKRKKLEVYC